MTKILLTCLPDSSDEIDIENKLEKYWQNVAMITRSCASGDSTVKMCNPKTAFLLSNVRKFKTNNNLNSMKIGGTVTAGELCNHLLNPQRVHGNILLSCWRLEEIENVKLKLRSFVNEYVDVFPMEILSPKYKRLSWYHVYKTSNASNFPDLNPNYSASFRRLTHLKQFKKPKNTSRKNSSKVNKVQPPPQKAPANVGQGRTECMYSLYLSTIDAHTEKKLFI